MRFRSYNFKVIESIWLAYMHVLALVAVYFVFQQDKDIIIRSVMGIAFFHAMGGLGITGGCHRLWAHKAYSAKTPLKVFLMLLNSMSFQGSIFHWSRDHRLHHKYSDTELDPHSMERGIFFSHVGWLLLQKDERLVSEGTKINMKDLLADPVVMFQKRHYYKLSFLCCFLLPALVGSAIIGQGIIYNFLTLGCLRYVSVLNSTWCVNSICHKFGSRPWNKNILPTDNLFVSLVTMGEGWHNWHHEYPRDWKGSKDDWWMFNPTASFIRLMEFFGQADTKNFNNENAVKSQ